MILRNLVHHVAGAELALVYIKKIELRGFKTFGKKVSISLDKGLTVITGPNGSGKSNVLDSVRFALGELSPKELRGASFSDIIHKNSPQLQARSAWVGIQFDNSDRRIPVEATLVTISREFRRGGEGIYRLNGRKISRKQLTEVLSSADIQVTGYNLIPQHAVTRLAEVTAEERRRIIEDMIGIGVYDLKKEEAQKQLSAAETNLRVASARTDEVKNRVESLERERNDFLRYTSLNLEIRRLEARIVSKELSKHRQELAALQTDTGGLQARIDEIKKKREELGARRESVESKRKEFERELDEKGNNELFEVERSASNLNARLAGLTAQIQSKKAAFRTSEKQKAALQLRLDQITSSIRGMKEELAAHQKRHREIVSSQTDIQERYNTISEKVKTTRERLGENTGKIEQIDQEIEKTSKQLLDVETRVAGNSTRVELLRNQKQSLEMRNADYSRLLEEMDNRLREIARLREEEEARTQNSSTKLQQYQLLIKMKEKEIAEAAEIARRASVSLAEFHTQEELVETMAPDVNALRKIEEMAQAGAIPGVYGKLGELAKVNERCLRAADAASAGWMSALVVKDIETAMSCAEILKRARLGRIKIIPVASVAPLEPIEDCPAIAGIIGRLLDFIEYPDEIKPAVHFVFGDTVLAEDQKAAFLASIEGVRSVVLTGDVYEPGGGMETGYFREPFDLTSMMPKTSAIQDLDQTLHSLETLIAQGELETQRLTKEITDLRTIETDGKNTIDKATKQIEEIQQNFSRAKNSLESTRLRIKEISDEIETQLQSLSPLKNSQDECKRSLSQLQKERASLKLSVKPAYLVQIENELMTLTKTLNEMKQEQIHFEGRISSLESSISTLDPTLDQIRIQYQSICQEIEKHQKSLHECEHDLNTTQTELKTLERRRMQLVEAVSAIKESQAEVDGELRTIRDEIDKTYVEYESVAQDNNQILAQIKEEEAMITSRLAKLKDLGHIESEEPEAEEPRRVETMLEVLRRELESIGAVNQLAPQQYEEVIGNYRQLSVKISELEKEKLAILSFINELDKKKRDTFMDALNQVNRNFQETFSDITNGGRGRLVLENPDKPFEEGLDMLLQFPDKAELGVTSASGGEKSVATVCFLLALQDIRQLPFYIFDEIDAHLDDLNSQRLADLLKTRSKNSQFMVISLRDTTVSRANRVYGVFVQNGTSQVVSIPAMVATK